MAKRILLLSGYDAASHRYWRNLLVENLPEFDWTQVALPDRHFAWRTRGSSLTIAFEYAEQVNQDFDLIIATSMVDLASLRGFVPKLANTPCVVYFHENQFAYPTEHLQQNLVNAQLTNVYSALAADSVVFNSAYNQSSFFQGAKALFKKLPDGIPKGLVEQISAKSQLIPVPINQAEQPKISKDNEQSNHKLSLLWNHRWEYDKQPEVLFRAAQLMADSEIDFILHVVGQQFRKVPECFASAYSQLRSYIGCWGFQQRERYERCLANSDIVISTANHDFQGVSMLEAIAHGCTPVAPDRLAYPEYIPSQFLYKTSNDPQQEAQHLFDKIIEVNNRESRVEMDIEAYLVEPVIRQYRNLILHSLR